MNAADITVDTTRLKHLFIGQPFTGKTSLLGTYTTSNIYVFDFDDELEPVLRYRREHPEIKASEIFYDTFLETGDLKQPKGYLNAFKRLTEMSAAASKIGKVQHVEGDKTYDIGLVALDGSTELLILAMNLQLSMAGRPGGFPQREDYGPQMAMYMRFINLFRALPCHTVVVCHEELEVNEADGKLYMKAAVTGKLANRLAAKFNLVLRTEKMTKGDKAFYRVLTTQYEQFVAGSRYAGAFDTYEEPNLDRLHAKLRAWQLANKTEKEGGEK